MSYERKGRVYRDDEEPDDPLPMIGRESWFYKGCEHCGNEHHATKDCPNRPLPS